MNRVDAFRLMSPEAALQWLLIGLAVALLCACDAADFSRQMHRAEMNERLRLSCIPEDESYKVVVGWYRGVLVCAHYKPGLKREPRIIATAKEME